MSFYFLTKSCLGISPFLRSIPGFELQLFRSLRLCGAGMIYFVVYINFFVIMIFGFRDELGRVFFWYGYWFMFWVVPGV